jgi:hypothetical protein
MSKLTTQTNSADENDLDDRMGRRFMKSFRGFMIFTVAFTAVCFFFMPPMAVLTIALPIIAAFFGVMSICDCCSFYCHVSSERQNIQTRAAGQSENTPLFRKIRSEVQRYMKKIPATL